MGWTDQLLWLIWAIEHGPKAQVVWGPKRRVKQSLAVVHGYPLIMRQHCNILDIIHLNEVSSYSIVLWTMIVKELMTKQNQKVAKTENISLFSLLLQNTK